MAGIKEIEIEGFKAFPNKFTLALDKNLLLYGENGSGKSSIYYALHVLLQSVYKSDHGAKYFRHEDSEENLINIYKLDDVKNNRFKPHIKITLDNDHQWELNREGLSCVPINKDDSELRLLNKTSAFINYSYISRFRSARNSETMNLWNVFIKDILPFYVPVGADKTLASIYDNLVANKHPYKVRKDIDTFNENLSNFIDNVNTKASKIYNKYFKAEDELDMLIQVKYVKDKDRKENPYNEEFYLFYKRETAGSAYVWRYPKIGLHIEIGEIVIQKPQSFFNEARLTAIALAIRFACLQSGEPQDGQFLALDDMLISLDMSNRMKVIDYLLSECNQYKIYLFTHDRAFYNFIWTKISKKKCNNQWLHKRIYIQHSEPVLIDDDDDYISKAKRFYQIQDYETSAIYLRKSLEETIGNLLPCELKTSAGGGFLSLETLWIKLVKYYSDNGKCIGQEIQDLFKNSKLLILNPAAHFQRLSSPIYKEELKQVFKLYDKLAELDNIDTMLCVEKGSEIIFDYPAKRYMCSFILNKDFCIYEGSRLICTMPKCMNIRWKYNDIEFYDFETKKANLNHPLKNATPKLDKFVNRLLQLPLGLTKEEFFNNCKIKGISLKDHFRNINIASLISSSSKT
ncbi:ATP-binding protein [Prevotella intermedia]|uniref:ATP-binding protein n=1 Tax=Prevotella intermedia TaxID=28131 RepID=UPI00077E0334|nr:ATP-binding protein [Prevotella intermedia]